MSAGEAAQLAEPATPDARSAPSEGLEPKPAIEHLAQDRGDDGAAPALSGTLPDPQPAIEHLAQDGGAAPVPSGTPAEPQPANERSAQDSGASPETLAERPDADRTEP